MRRTAIGFGVALIALLTLSGCVGSGGSSTSLEQVKPNNGPVDLGAKGKAADGSAAGKNTENVTNATGRQVVTTGSVTLTVKDPVATARKAVSKVESAGGRVDDRSEHPKSETRAASATLTLRIPSGNLTRVLDQLKKLGTVDSVSIKSTDVTSTAEDLDARITALQTSVDRLIALMDKATDTSDLIDIESALSDRQADLESLQARRTSLKDQVNLATITLQLNSKTTVATTVPGDFFSGLLAGWNSLMVAGAGFLVFLGVALPWLVLLAVIGAIVWVGIRGARRRKQRRAQTE